MPYLEQADSAIYYEVYGTGKALVFIHGAAGNTLSWWQQADFFAQHYQVILLDLRGWGRSRGTVENPLNHTDLHHLLNHLGITTCAMLGQSLGGRVVSGFCQAYPNVVQVAILCGATAGLPLSPELAEIHQQKQDIKKLNELWYTGEGTHPAFGTATSDERLNLMRLFSWMNSLNPPRPPVAESPMKVVIQPSDLPQHCLFISGTEDQVVPTAVVQGVAQLVPNAEFVAIPNCGHSPYFENPTVFNAAVMRFLQEHY